MHPGKYCSLRAAYHALRDRERKYMVPATTSCTGAFASFANDRLVNDVNEAMLVSPRLQTPP
jgi:hypothetical protein